MFEAAYYLCSLAPGLSAVISWKLLKLGTKTSFINFLYFIIFFINTVNVFFMIHFFFKVGRLNMIENKGNTTE